MTSDKTIKIRVQACLEVRIGFSSFAHLCVCSIWAWLIQFFFGQGVASLEIISRLCCSCCAASWPGTWHRADAGPSRPPPGSCSFGLQHQPTITVPPPYLWLSTRLPRKSITTSSPPFAYGLWPWLAKTGQTNVQTFDKKYYWLSLGPLALIAWRGRSARRERNPRTPVLMNDQACLSWGNLSIAAATISAMDGQKGQNVSNEWAGAGNNSCAWNFECPLAILELGNVIHHSCRLRGATKQIHMCTNDNKWGDPDPGMTMDAGRFHFEKNIEAKHKMPDTHVRTPKWWGITSHWVWFANSKLDNKKHIIARIFLRRNRHKRPRGQPGWLCLLITHFSQKAGQPPMLTGMEVMGVSSLVGGGQMKQNM